MRGMTSAQIAALTAGVVNRVLAIEMEFDSGTSRIVTAPYDIEIEGNTFVGGLLASISNIEEVSEMQASTMTGELSGIPSDAIAVALSEEFQGRRVTVWFVPMDQDNSQIAFDSDYVGDTQQAWDPIAPFILFRGLIDQMEIELGDTAKVVARFINRLASWEQPRIQRYSDEEQQQQYPGDLFFQYAAAMENKEVTWPNRIRLQVEAGR